MLGRFCRRGGLSKFIPQRERSVDDKRTKDAKNYNQHYYTAYYYRNNLHKLSFPPENKKCVQHKATRTEKRKLCFATTQNFSTIRNAKKRAYIFTESKKDIGTSNSAKI